MKYNFNKLNPKRVVCFYKVFYDEWDVNQYEIYIITKSGRVLYYTESEEEILAQELFDEEEELYFTYQKTVSLDYLQRMRKEYRCQVVY